MKHLLSGRSSLSTQVAEGAGIERAGEDRGDILRRWFVLFAANLADLRLFRTQPFKGPALNFEPVTFEMFQEVLQISKVLSDRRWGQTNFRNGARQFSRFAQFLAFST